MAKPQRRDGRDRTLGTLTLEDMLAKLRWEVGEFHRLAAVQIDDRNLPARYMAQNAASTAWHMTDWLAAELEDRSLWAAFSVLADREIKSKSELGAFLRGSYALLACQQIAFAVKHMRIDENAYEDGIIMDDRFFDVIGEIDAGGNVTRVDHFEERKYPIPLVVLRDAGRFSGTYELGTILDVAVAFWTSNIETIREALN